MHRPWSGGHSFPEGKGLGGESVLIVAPQRQPGGRRVHQAQQFGLGFGVQCIGIADHFLGELHVIIAGTGLRGLFEPLAVKFVEDRIRLGGGVVLGSRGHKEKGNPPADQNQNTPQPRSFWLVFTHAQKIPQAGGRDKSGKPSSASFAKLWPS